MSLKRIIPIGYIDESTSVDLLDIDFGNTWMTLIISYIQHGELFAEKQQARKLRIQSARYSLIGDKLYKHSLSGPYLHYFGPEEAHYVIREIHEGDCGITLARDHSSTKS